MKTFVITLTTVVLTCLLSPSVVLATDSPDRDRSAQSGTTVVFWTNETSQGPIRVYVNRCYVGTITTSYPSAPRCGAPGCVTVILSRGNNTWYGVAADGTRWFSGNSRLHRGCNSVRLHHAGVSDGNVPVPLPESRHPGSARLECKDLMGPDRGFCRKGVPYLGLDLGASVFYGEFARLIFATGNVSGFYLYGGVGRDIIFDRKNSDRLLWHAGAGMRYSFDRDHVSMGVVYGENPLCYNQGVLLEFVWHRYFGNSRRIGMFAGGGVGLGDFGANEPAFVWDAQIGISIKLWQR
ncbi:MAG TPA: hypothetical protein IAC98_04015 [Candidatus Cryptobacteroides pullicola]|nr:hypothetical protein [Candidatus Cryptobacteroides pullicola]